MGCDAGQVDRCGKPIGIHFARVRGENEISFAYQLFRIFPFGSGVGVEVFTGGKLGGIYKDRHHDMIGLGTA